MSFYVGFTNPNFPLVILPGQASPFATKFLQRRKGENKEGKKKIWVGSFSSFKKIKNCCGFWFWYCSLSFFFSSFYSHLLFALKFLNRFLYLCFCDRSFVLTEFLISIGPFLAVFLPSVIRTVMLIGPLD